MREDWDIRLFKDVFDLQMGKTPDRKNFSLFEGDNTWVSIKDLDGKYISNSKECISDEAAKNIRLVKRGTVIMSFKLTIGKTAIAGKDLYTNEAIMAFNLRNGYDIDASFATAYDFENKKYSFKNQGQGLGLDLGFTYMKNRYHENSEREYLYDYKIDVSLLDFGKINFNGEVHNFKGNPIFLPSYKPFGKNNSPSEFMQSMSQKVYGNLTQSLQNQEFEIGLPTMLNISFSKSTSDNTYLTGGISQRVPIFKNSLKKANNIYINYGYYKDFIGLATSFSLHNYKIPQFGGYIRIGGLYLGSDNLLPLIIKQRKLHSFDFYFGLKLFPFWNNDAKRRWKSKCCD